MSFSTSSISTFLVLRTSLPEIILPSFVLNFTLSISDTGFNGALKSSLYELSSLFLFYFKHKETFDETNP